MSTPGVPLAEALQGARQRVADFLGAVSSDARVVVFCHYDADGLAAGAILGRALPRMGFAGVEVVPSLRGESAFSDEARARLLRLRPEALIVTDLGVHRFGVLPGVPTLYIDHHRPSGAPPGAVVVSGYGWDPIPNSSWMALDVLRPLADVDDLGWIAAVGTLSDLGDGAPWSELPALKKRYTAKWLREAVSLVNAARRAAEFDVETPLRLLLAADHPREVSENEELGSGRLHTYRAEVNDELKRARRQAPTFSGTHPFALVRIHSPCQIHPLIAQQWRGRLKDYAVISANSGYLPDVVAFSMRTARPDLNLPEILQSIDLGEFNGRYGQGHDQASGGHLPPQTFERLLAELGFPPGKEKE